MGMMGVAQENIHLNGRIELDETFIRTGHKSLTAEELGDNIASFPCRTRRGLSWQQVCISCGVDSLFMPKGMEWRPAS